MSAESASVESASLAGPVILEEGPADASFEGRSKCYVLTLERDAYHSWKIVHQYMTARMKPDYALVCEHDGPDYPHIHCFYQYHNNKSMSTKNLPRGVHVETKLKKTPQAYRAYCKAADEKHLETKVNSITLVEEGEIRKAGGARTIGDIKKMSRDEIDKLPVQYYNIAEKIIEKEHREQSFFDMLAEIRRDKLEAPDVYYISGPPGQGKTYGAYKLAQSMFEDEEIGRIKFCNQFATIDNEKAKCFVIEEFRSSDLRASELLQLMDKYGTNVNIKGGFVYLRPKCLIICSFYAPDELYQKDELTEQFVRRITKHYIADGYKLI